MKNNKNRDTSSLDLSKIYKSIEVLDASIEMLLITLANKNSSELDNKQCNFKQQKQPKNNKNFGKKKLNTDLIKQILMETKKRKKETTKKQKVEK